MRHQYLSIVRVGDGITSVEGHRRLVLGERVDILTGLVRKLTNETVNSRRRDIRANPVDVLRGGHHALIVVRNRVTAVGGHGRLVLGEIVDILAALVGELADEAVDGAGGNVRADPVDVLGGGLHALVVVRDWVAASGGHGGLVLRERVDVGLAFEDVATLQLLGALL